MGAVIKSLEPYSGPYAVSTTDLELPIPAPRRRQFPLPTLKHSKGEPAFKLETVLFTLFYPADETRPGSGHSQPWVQRPIDVTAAGYSRFLGQREDLCRWMFKLAGESLQLPAEADRPLAPPPSPPPTSTAPPSSSSADRIRTETSERGAFPLIIFSHGMSGQRTTYRCAFFPLSRSEASNETHHLPPFSQFLIYNGFAVDGAAIWLHTGSSSPLSSTGTARARSASSDSTTKDSNEPSISFGSNRSSAFMLPLSPHKIRPTH